MLEELASRVIRPWPDALCLDFTCTLVWRGRAQPEERLHSPDDLLDWCLAHGLIEAGERRWWARRLAADGLGLLAETRSVRELIYAVFAAVAADEPIGARRLDALNLLVGLVPPRSRLVGAEGGHGWAVAAPASVATLLAPVVWSAADLLAGPRRGLVRRCAGPDCGWLFLDESKNRSRRWCAMSDCGNRAKARRHYQRHRLSGR